MSTSSNHNASVPSWVNVLIYIILLTILYVFGDTLVWIIGFIGVTALFVGYFNRFGEKSEDLNHH